jgi:alpha-D-xyloside xylohydrolase
MTRLPDSTRLAASSASAAEHGLSIETAAGPIAFVWVAPGVLRVSAGPTDLPDYGLVDRPIPPPQAAKIEDGGASLTLGRDQLRLTADPLGFALARDGRTRLASPTDKHFRGWTRLPVLAATSDGWFLSFDLPAGTPVLGLGEKFGPLDRTGQLVVSRNEDALGVATEHSYKNIPFAWSPAGWGLLVDTPAAVTHGIGYGPWSHRSYGLWIHDHRLEVYLLLGDQPGDLLTQLHGLTGKPVVPPLWTLGVWFSRAYYRTEAEFLETAAEIRRRRMPADVITLDGRAWLDVDSRCTLDFDPARYPDPAATMVQVKALGLKVCCWEYPYVSVRNPHFRELADQGFLLRAPDGGVCVFDWDKDPATSPFGKVLTPLPESGIIDFTHPGAAQWWAARHQRLFDFGVDVMKTDFGEQVPDHARAHNGDDGRRLHNVYARLYNQCVFEATRDHGPSGGAIWTRDGWIGAQRYPLGWGGDPQSDWGGLACSIRGGLSWGMSGVPLHATDVGGFYGDQPDAELFLRWVAAAVFASHFRFHGIGAREPWAFGDEAEVIARGWLELRYRLIPYLAWTIAQAGEIGLPVMRAMPLAFPRERAAWGYETQFMCGDALLVAPIVAAGGEVEVWLPEGAWIDAWTGERLTGGRAITCHRPLDRSALFGRVGTMLPLGRVVQHTGEIDPADPLAAVLMFGDADPDWFPGAARAPRVTRLDEL